MAESSIPYGRRTQHAPAVEAMHILWITAGLGCDGDSIAITAATQPSLEDLVLGAIPGLPEVHLHHPVLAYENGDEFLESWYLAAAGPAGTVLARGGRARSPTSVGRPRVAGPRSALTGEPASRSRPARGSIAWPPRRGAWSRLAPAPPTAASTPWRETRPAAWACPTTWAGIGGRRRGCPSSACRVARCSRTTSWKCCFYLLNQAAGKAPTIPLDELLRPAWLFGETVHEGCDRAGYYEQGDFAARPRLARVHRQARMLGAGGAMQRRQAGLDGRHRRLPQRRRRLHRLHHARLPRQVHAVSRDAARGAPLHRGRRHVRQGDPGTAAVHAGVDEPRARVAHQRNR